MSLQCPSSSRSYERAFLVVALTRSSLEFPLPVHPSWRDWSSRSLGPRVFHRAPTQSRNNTRCSLPVAMQRRGSMTMRPCSLSLSLFLSFSRSIVCLVSPHDYYSRAKKLRGAVCGESGGRGTAWLCCVVRRPPFSSLRTRILPTIVYPRLFLDPPLLPHATLPLPLRSHPSCERAVRTTRRAQHSRLYPSPGSLPSRPA